MSSLLSRISRSLSTKLLVIFELVLLAAVLALLLPVHRAMREQVIGDLQNELRSIASTAALQLDGDKLATIRSSADVASPAFAQLRDTLAKVRDVNGLTEQHIYTFYRDPENPNQVRFGVMTHAKPFVGDPYELRPEMRMVFEEGRANTTGLYHDQYGSFISAYAPVRDSAGKIVGIVEVDKPAASYFARYRAVRWMNVSLGLIVLAMTSLLGWLVLNAIVIRPMRAVREGMLALGRRNFSHRVQLTTRDEFQDLGETLNHISRELNVARSVQTGFLPSTLPQQAGYRMAAASEPCEATAGDYFDAFALDENRTAILVADVTGHGLGPSLLMSACRSALHALAQADLEPAQIIARLDKLLSRDLQDGRFITMIFGVLDIDGRFTFTNAGHGPAMIVTASGIERLGPHCPPLGVGIDANGDGELSQLQTAVHLAPGDRVFLASDGVSEAMNPAGEQFGYDRLEAIVGDRSLTYEQVVQRLQQELSHHCGGPMRKDDVTILCVDRVKELAGITAAL